MAAVIMAVRRFRRKSELDTAVGEMDEDGDGSVSVQEMRGALSKVAIRADILLDRLTLESRMMVVMCGKLPVFIICMMFFLVAIMEFKPADTMRRIHNHLVTHFLLDDALEVDSLEGIYDYILEFEHKNEEMQATSFHYWCESRYSNYYWDDEYQVPVFKCPSPRMYSLGLGGESWSSLHGGASSESDDDASGDSGHRRMAGAGGASGGGSSVANSPPCIDDDDGLQIAEADPNATCAGWAHHVCDITLGLEYCRLTCGFCAPFVYEHRKRFEKPQVTMLPVMLHQTRFHTSDCHGFAETYERQPYNPNLYVMPALDGERHDRVLTCIDRSWTHSDDFAFELNCPAGSPITHCPDGKFHVTDRHYFLGEAIYPILLTQVNEQVPGLQAIEWLDLQTNVVTLSTMVYTEGVEVFTLLTVEFHIDEAGNVIGSHDMMSYRDLVGDAKTRFLVCISISCFLALVGAGFTIVRLVRNYKTCDWKAELFELLSKVSMAFYAPLLVITWAAQVPMADEFEELYHKFLEAENLHHDEMYNVIDGYFEAKTHMYAEVSWLKRHKIAIYLLLYVQFLQLVSYMNVHPKLAMLTQTVQNAMGSIMHFLLIFFILFSFLAFMAHWMLGDQIPAFGTLGDTFSAQGRMLYGEFIYADGAELLSGSMMAMYWIYAFTFMLVVVFTLLNFFLAIVVDAFADVQRTNSEAEYVKSVATDLVLMVASSAKGLLDGWPRKTLIKEYLTGVVEAAKSKQRKTVVDHIASVASGKSDEYEHPLVTPQDLMRDVPAFTKSSVATFLTHYVSICPQILTTRSSDNDTAENRDSLTAHNGDKETDKPPRKGPVTF